MGKKPLNVVDQSETAEEHLQVRVRVLKRPSLWNIYTYIYILFFFTKEAEDMTSLTVVSVQVISFFFLNPKTRHEWIRSLISLLQMDINLTTRGQSSFFSAIQFAFFLFFLFI